MRRLNGVMAALAAACLASGVAQAGCWNAAELAAAQVRDLQTMLMVATLRCRAAGIDISVDYNAFIRARRIGIEGVNLTLKGHFWAAGPVEGQRAYDRFTTQLANAYGSADTGPETCAEAAALARSAARLTDDAGTLDMLATGRPIMPAIAAESCTGSGSGATVVLAAR